MGSQGEISDLIWRTADAPASGRPDASDGVNDAGRGEHRLETLDGHPKRREGLA
jgi:hypothetical protein